MKTKAVRLYAENDIRLEEFELPELKNGDLLIKIVSDSVCMSTYKTVKQGAKHIRVPDDVAQHPAIIGHEFCAEIVTVTEKWEDRFKAGEKVVMSPVLSYLGGMQTVGYSFGHIGGDATYCVVDDHIIENGHLIKLESDAFFSGSLIEPASCVIRGYKANLHLDEDLNPYTNIRPGGKTAILAGCGPMGLLAIDIALHGDVKPSLLVVTDLDHERLERAEQIFGKDPEVKVIFTDTTDKDALLALTDGTGFDDVFVYAPVPAVVELADAVLGFDGCLNFFAGPLDKQFSANFNFYNVHYAQHHVAGTSGSNLEDMHDIVRLIGEKRIDPAVMITHIGGMDAVIDTTVNLPQIPGGKKLIYTHIELPLTALSDFAKLGETDPRFRTLDTMVSENNGLWSAKAEQYLLENF
ncbi:MAG: zinc-binding dehydrogenase [Oscillospiraceae bacterium]|nr:zinc-binding dehydrogenase [Oscillospiraceae bacterium]